MNQSPTSSMSIKERLFHSVLFEIGAIMLGMLLILCFSDTKVDLAFGVGLSISLIATVWNFMFNYTFDKIFTVPAKPADWLCAYSIPSALKATC